jgi:DNA replication protein DnaC
MIPPEALAAWRAGFLREAGIDPALLDGDHIASTTPGMPATAGDRIPPRYADALATDPQIRAWMAAITRQAIADLQVILSVTSGPSLLLLGPTGTGKTHEAFGAMRGLVALGLRVNWRAITAADFYARLRPRHGIDSETEFREFAGARLLALDDLGAGKPSEWTEEVNFRLVNFRYEHQLATLFTSNLLPKNLVAALGDRVSSRLAEMTTRATLRGGDRRYRAGGGMDAA